MSEPAYSHYRDIDGAYVAQPYIPNREQAEIHRWERLTGLPWDIPASDLMMDLSDLGRGTNHGAGPAWTDLCESGYFESEDR